MKNSDLTKKHGGRVWKSVIYMGFIWDNHRKMVT